MEFLIISGIFVIAGIISFVVAVRRQTTFLWYVSLFLIGGGAIWGAEGLELNSYHDYHVNEIAEKYTIVEVKGERETIKTYYVDVQEVNSNVSYVVEVSEDDISLYENGNFRCKQREFLNSYDRKISKTYNYNK